MQQSKVFASEHDDFVHDVAYDHYGKRLASCSSDHTIKVWSEGTSGEWQCDAELKGHHGAVWKLAWAHPEFGQVLASCSFDKEVLIWEELDTPSGAGDEGGASSGGGAGGDKLASGAGSGAGAGEGAGECASGLAPEAGAGSSRWQKVASLKGDGRESVSDLKFAPRHFGLCLATCSTDGFVRIFVADDVMNLEEWRLSDKFEATRDKEEATCLSWNPSRFDSRMLVIGSTASVKVWAKNQSERRWEVLVDLRTGSPGAINDVCWAPNLGRSYHLIAAAAGKAVELWRLTWGEGHKPQVDKEADLPAKSEVWRAEWNVTGTVLATAGDDGTIGLWRKSFQNRWNLIAKEELGEI